MSDRSIPLEQFQIQTPCTEDWSGMHGDESKRFCDKCNKHVHDLAHFDRDQADALLNAQTAGHVCVRMARDGEGRVITRDYWKFAAGAALAATVGLNACQRTQGQPLAKPPEKPVDSATMGKPNPSPRILMGEMCPAPSKPAPPPEPLQGKVAAPPQQPQPLTGTPVPMPPAPSGPTARKESSPG